MTIFAEARKVVMDGTINKCDYWGLAQAIFPDIVDEYPTLLSIITSPELVHPEKTTLRRMGPRIKLEHLRKLYYMGPVMPCTGCEYVCGHCKVCACECRGSFCPYVGSCLCECCC